MVKLNKAFWKRVLRYTSRKWRAKCSQLGITIKEETTLHTFPDDQVVVAHDEKNLELMTRKLFAEYQK